MRTVGGVTTHYTSRWHEVRLSPGNDYWKVHYWLGDRLVATYDNVAGIMSFRYVHADSLGSPGAATSAECDTARPAPCSEIYSG